ncbi:heavy-metal-associated domain-containing protein [Ramlibacter sp. PS3R-8]|uniref:heavy-metal-associated domain-containing protein n=1 Tax=Ramlibacter sp. PS3R-8 TaxID=3133437 RepID=UPI00309B0917
MEALQLKIDGMTCGSCVKAATRALAAVPGVEAVEVRLQEGIATVRGGAIAGKSPALIAALQAAGYQARLAGAEAGSPKPHAGGNCGSGRAAGGCCCGR